MTSRQLINRGLPLKFRRAFFKAVKEQGNEEHLDQEADRLYDVIEGDGAGTCLVRWSETYEGYSFWERVSDSIEDDKYVGPTYDELLEELSYL